MEQALHRLQKQVRQPSRYEDSVLRLTLPKPLQREDAKILALTRSEVDAMTRVELLLANDLRFEHVQRAESVIREFVMQAWSNPLVNHVPAFMAANHQPIETLTCFLAVEHLIVNAPLTVADLLLVSPNDPRVPPAGTWRNPKSPAGCVAIVDVEGTDGGNIIARARAHAEHVLRLLRIALPEVHNAHDQQLLFLLGPEFAYDEQRSGWVSRTNHAYSLELNSESVAAA